MKSMPAHCPPSTIARCIRTALLGGAFLGPALASAAASAQEAPAGSQATTLDTVTVTGSRIQRTSTDTETAEPVGVISGEVFAERGYLTAAEALNDLPQVMGSLTNQGDQQGANTGRQFINLFNLGTQRTLTLVNGRRFVGSNPAGGGQGGNQVDMNNIPVGLIDRIETVQASGAAVYGSDAIAGVVNIILKQDFEGLEFDGQTGLSDKGDYENHAARVTFGRNFLDGRANLAVNAEWSKSGTLLTNDRRATRRGFVFAANPANTSNDDGIPASIGMWDHRMSEHTPNGVVYLAPAPLRQFLANVGGSPVQFDSSGNLVPYDIGNYFAPAYSFGGDGLKISDYTAVMSPVERSNLTLLGRYDINDNVRFSTELLASRLKAREPINQGVFNSVLAPGTVSGPTQISIDNPFLSDQARGLLQSAGISSFFLSRFHTDILPDAATYSDGDTYRAVFALDGNFYAGDRYYYWNASVNGGRTTGSFHDWGIVQQRWQYATDPVRDGAGNIVCRVSLDNPGSADPAISGCVPVNLFGYGAPSQAARDYLVADFATDFELEQRTYQANFGGEPFELAAGPVNFVVGWEYRKEESDYRPNEASRLGLGRGTPVTPVRGAYSTNEFYGEVLVPVLGGDFTFGPIDRLELNASYRSVDNSLAGKNEAMSLGMRMTVFEDLTLRGSRSKTFRAPNLYELFLPRSTVNQSGIDPCDSRHIDAGNVPAIRRANCEAMFQSLGLPADYQLNSLITNVSTNVITGGNPDLKNELADSWTAGFVYQPRFASGVTLVVDWVNIKIRDAITNFNVAAVMQSCYDQVGGSAYCDAFQRDAQAQVIPGSPQVGYSNAGYLHFAATNYSVDWELPMAQLFGGAADPGRLNLALNVLQMRKLNVSTSGLGFDEFKAVGTGLLGSSVVGPTPEWQARFNARYARGPWTLNWNTQYIDSLVFSHTDTIENRDILGKASYTQHDASLQYRFNDHLALRLVVNNVFDTQPSDPVAQGAGTYAELGDLIGRYYYFGVNYRF